MNNTNEVGVPLHVTATGTIWNIGVSGRRAALLGISVGANLGTAPLVRIWEGQVTGATTIIGGLTCALNTFTRIPASCSGGASFWFLNSEAPDITIYWNPLG